MIRKKGQTEDFVADFIPSLIIIIIGLYVLSEMEDIGIKTTEETKNKLLERLEDRKTINDYMFEERKIDNETKTLIEWISLIYKNKEHQTELILDLAREDIAELRAPVETISGTQEQEPVETTQHGRKECIKLDIQYPDSSKLEIGGKCDGTEQIFYLPTFEGQYIQVKSIAGTTTS